MSKRDEIYKARFPLLITFKNAHMQEIEPILKPHDPSRFVLFPVQYHSVFEFYKKHLASFWTAEEISFSEDIKHFESLTEDERFFIKHVLAFFAASDGIVNENLSTNFASEVQIPEARAFYSMQGLAETVHSETYSLLIDTYVSDADEKMNLFRAIENFSAIKDKAEWALHWMNRERPFPERIVAFACVEGVHFSASFEAIFWLRKRGLMPGLCFANELIARDEGMHADFACLLYSLLEHKITEDRILEIVEGAVEVEKKFITESLPVALIGINNELMQTYIEFVADRLLVELGCRKKWNAQNPFEWMTLISLQGKTNFFERRVGDYQKSGVMASMTSASENHAFSLEEDF